MGKLLKTLVALVVLAGAATGVYAFSRGGKKADGGMKLVGVQLGSLTMTPDVLLADEAA